MRENLFREEALLSQYGTRFGDPVFYQPLSLKALALSATAFLAVLLAFAAFAQVKQTESVRGYLSAVGGEVKIFSARNAVINELHVSNGQFVAKGDLLASLSEPGVDESGADVHALLIQHLDEQISALEKRLALLQDRRLMTREQRELRVLALVDELSIREHEFSLTQLQQEMAEKDYARLGLLGNLRVISERELEQGRTALLSVQKSVQSNRLAMESTRRLLQQSDHERILDQSLMADEQLMLEINLSQLLQRREEMLFQQGFALTAPVSGRINNLLLAPGDQLDARHPFAGIAPEQARYQAQLFVPSRALGQVETGQDILLSYDAFPFYEHGVFQATVKSISELALDPRQYMIPLELNEPVYLLVAELGADNAALTLRSGLQFSAHLVTGQRSILRGILEPFDSVRRRL